METGVYFPRIEREDIKAARVNDSFLIKRVREPSPSWCIVGPIAETSAARRYVRA